jgi:hypothetical protein
MKLINRLVATRKLLSAGLTGMVCLILSNEATATIQITEFEIENGTIRLVVEDTEAVFTEFSLQSSTQLTPESWGNPTGATFSVIDETHFLFTVPVVSANGEFFRVIGIFLGTGLDPDGDGLPEALETLLGTNPGKFDTDEDGFSDGVEYAYGTNPVLKTSSPDLTNLPRAEFAEAKSFSNEGSETHEVLVKFNKPYTGTLKYNVLALSTAKVTVDYQTLSLAVTVTGTSVVIPITWIDDDVINPERVLFLEIETDDALPYARGGQTRHMILLSENDAWWSGVLSDKYAQRNFQLKLVHIGGTTEATFSAGAGNDGLSLLVGETDGSRSDQSVGVVPKGTFPAVVEEDTATHFKISSPLMPASTGGLFGAATGLTRTLILESLPSSVEPSNGHDITGRRLIGAYTEQLAFPGQEPSVNQTGTFVLAKQLSARPEVIQ